MAKISPLMIAPPLIFGAFAVLAAIGMFREDPNALPSAREGQPAPPVVLAEFPGKQRFDDATLRDGQVKLVNYWASWCAPCRAEHPNLEKLAQEGIPVYGINYKDKLANADAFLAELGDPYAAIGRDENGRMGLDWGVYGVPETYVIDGDGTIILRFAGPITQRVIENTIRPALEKAAAQ
ncbi:cytochrome c biogenesis protein CcmG, thiol:disulfide interchange protein DsbE [Ruegeria intermedia]|uniref:Cytochrome c biogenesis protein CcmG, thiol:disulfide interchange protein DsbE n=1 Tax=Ruegeria intermedia TaxID=996115 RepID=A0A1M4UFT2_9RHOB|nr:DsbE family thiol:disulfide interchange protein [Ruegeria intermedia]SHE55527.1 cytochrome c biogenesis protein CcmG, thiol:disulfide interchange protein DsbE [Ruegeria intermedia]